MILNRRIIASGVGLLSGSPVVIYQEDSPMPDVDIDPQRTRDDLPSWWVSWREWFVRLFGG